MEGQQEERAREAMSDGVDANGHLCDTTKTHQAAGNLFVLCFPFTSALSVLQI